VVRAKLSADAMSLTEVSEIFRAQPSKQGGAHFGARLLFLPDSTLLISLGDGFRWMNEAQKPDNHFGKIVRINSDGSIPADNPGFDGTSAAGVFSIGHRNVQGLARDPQTGTLYAVEHGPKGGDELNRIEAGRNYGWPVISYGINYDGSILTSETAREGMEQPLTYWVPSIATSSLLFYSGEAFPAWKGDLFVGALAGMKVERVDIENGTVMGREALFEELEQRIRSVDQAPDGSLILLTDALDGQVLRIAPAR
jgi:glucose/arabinose dehydrogenase